MEAHRHNMHPPAICTDDQLMLMNVPVFVRYCILMTNRLLLLQRTNVHNIIPLKE